MDTISVPKTTRPERGLALYRDRGAEIVRILPHVWSVPSCTGTTTYVVHLDRQTCECPDFERHHKPCKHLYSAQVKAAKARAA